MQVYCCEATGMVGGSTLIRGGGKEKGEEQLGYVPPPGQKRGLDWRFASERPSNSAPQTPDFLF